MLMLRVALPLLLALLYATILSAQPTIDIHGDMGIGTLAPHPSALLELSSTTKGLLVPRLTTEQRNSMTNPARGLVIFNTDTREFQYYLGDTTGFTGQPNWSCIINDLNIGNNAWLLQGNAGTVPGQHFLGTTDNTPLEIHVYSANNKAGEGTGRALRIEPAIGVGSSPNLIGGVRENYVVNTVGGVIAGGGSVDAPNVISGLYSTISGGRGDTIQGDYNTIGGGRQNKVSGQHNIIGSGYGNAILQGTAVTLGGGAINGVLGNYSSLVGGFLNGIIGHYGAIGGGGGNVIRDTAGYGVIAGGNNNTVTEDAGVVSGGILNNVSGYASVISGGRENSVQGEYSVIAGGNGLQLRGNGSFGFLGDNRNGHNDMEVDSSAIALFANVDLWLANNNGKPGELRFYEAKEGRGNFPDGAHYTAFVAREQSSNITYKLPRTITPTQTVRSGLLQTDSSGNLSWVDPDVITEGNAAWLLSGNANINPATDFLGTQNNRAFEIRINNNASDTFDAYGRVARFIPHHSSPNILFGYKGNSIDEDVHGVVIAGGGQYGAGGPNHVGDHYGTISGGYGNTIDTGQGSTISGGRLHRIEDHFATIGGGSQNIASNEYATIGGGLLNRVYGFASTVAGGDQNWVDSAFSTIAGGNFNGVRSRYGTIAGGKGNRVTAEGGAIGGGRDNWDSCNYGTIAGGEENRLFGPYGTIAGGRLNEVHEKGGSVGGGEANMMQGWMGVIGGGVSNRVTGTYSVITGGRENNISEGIAFIGGGVLNEVHGRGGTIGGGNGSVIYDSAEFATIAGGQINGVEGKHSFVGGGYANFIRGYGGAIAGGYINSMNDTLSSIAGGYRNYTSGNFAAISGGYQNSVEGDFSAIIGGSGLTLRGDGSVGFLGGSRKHQNNMRVDSNGIALFANVDLWLANNDGAASVLRFYEAAWDTGAFPNGTHYTQFKAGAQSEYISYTLPNSLFPRTTPARAVMQVDSSGAMSWVEPSALRGNDWRTEGNSGTDPATQFLGTTDSAALMLRTNNIEQATLTATGNLGLGDVTPEARLDVENNSSTLPTLELTNNHANGTALNIIDGKMILSYATYTADDAAGITPQPVIGDDVIVVDVSATATDGAGQPQIDAPATGTNGQVIWIVNSTATNVLLGNANYYGATTILLGRDTMAQIVWIGGASGKWVVMQ